MWQASQHVITKLIINNKLLITECVYNLAGYCAKCYIMIGNKQDAHQFLL